MTTINGSFESGNFTGWETLGDTRIETSSFGSGPTEGSFQALITNGSGSFFSVSDTELETFLGLTSGSLDNLGNGDATEGSAIQQTITVSANDQLSFDWNFLTNEGTPSSFNDFAFVSITSLDTLVNTNSNFILSTTVFPQETGFGTFSFSFTTSGTYTVSIGVVDVGDSSADSAVLIDNFTLFAQSPILGTLGDDVLQGNNGNNIISGLEGDDTIIALAGSDQIFAGSGEDLVEAGDGDDLVEGEAGNDLLSGNAGDDTITGGDGRDIIFGGDGNDILSGNLGSDRLFGESGNDQINGNEGNDIIQAGEGSDTVSGGTGKDRLLGGFGEDQLFGDNGNDQLYGDIGYDSLEGGGGNDLMLGGSEDDSLNGGSGLDTLEGGFGFDSLEGGNGNDRLIGVDVLTGLGTFETDTLTGGLGSDTFVLGDATYVYYDDGNLLSTGEFDYALITDFNASEDVIQLRGSADLYSLDFFPSETGTTNAAIIFDPGVEARGEVIGILQNLSTTLNLTDPAFLFV